METEDIAVAAIRYAEGAVGTVSATTCAFPGLPERIELIGEAGVAILDGTVLKVAFHSGEVLEAGDAALDRNNIVLAIYRFTFRFDLKSREADFLTFFFFATLGVLF